MLTLVVLKGILNLFKMTTEKTKKKKLSRGDLYNKNKDISLPKEDIKVEKGQHTFLPALKKIIKKEK